MDRIIKLTHSLASLALSASIALTLWLVVCQSRAAQYVVGAVVFSSVLYLIAGTTDLIYQLSEVDNGR